MPEEYVSESEVLDLISPPKEEKTRKKSTDNGSCTCEPNHARDIYCKIHS
jgi:hypothetical protein